MLPISKGTFRHTSELRAILDSPPSYEELFGTEHKVDTPPSSPMVTEAVNELRAEEEAERQRLRCNQNRYMVSETRANPPEAPHFLSPDLRPWMRSRNDFGQLPRRERDSNSEPSLRDILITTGRGNRRATEPTGRHLRLYAQEMALYPERRVRSRPKTQRSDSCIVN
ncbi:uncharacterized protein LOC124143958 isoform X3 [Haliotis rufescens]|uniref:uncharacterized protein LOC124143958 isoform X3 n=1 Tax=Haliotis rufescens TaxID=6454 RepID=UPI001EAFAAFD|nr:uncharacterized protein LOC124143958 isoform X3 [Haliotis rufescens]